MIMIVMIRLIVLIIMIMIMIYALPHSVHVQGSGGVTCLTLLVQRWCSLKVANHVAN